MTGWEKQWQDESLIKLWSEFPPMREVVEMADKLQDATRKSILDIGCGMGRHTLYLAARGFEVLATDNAPTALQHCRENLVKAQLRAEVRAMEMTDFPFEDGCFDGVIASYVIHHTTYGQIGEIVESVARCLRPGGYFVWVTPTPKHCDWGRGEEVEPGTWVDQTHEYGNPHHYCTEAEMLELLGNDRAKLNIVSMREQERIANNKSYYHWCVLAQK